MQEWFAANLEALLATLGAVGSLASMIALALVVRDLPKTRKAAERAESAAIRAQRGLDERLRIADASACAGLAREIEAHLRDPKNWEAAFYRVQELHANVLDLQSIPTSDDSPNEEDFERMVESLRILRGRIEQVISDELQRDKAERTFDVDSAKLALQNTQDEMHRWKARLTRKIVEGAVQQ